MILLKTLENKYHIFFVVRISKIFPKFDYCLYILLIYSHRAFDVGVHVTIILWVLSIEFERRINTSSSFSFQTSKERSDSVRCIKNDKGKEKRLCLICFCTYKIYCKKNMVVEANKIFSCKRRRFSLLFGTITLMTPDSSPNSIEGG